MDCRAAATVGRLMILARLARLLTFFPTVCACQVESPRTLPLPLWPQGAPGSEARRAEAEEVGPWWVKNVHFPTLTAVLPAPGRANGTAVVILPGGGHERLVFGPEGLEPARLLAERGVSAFVLKYRLAEEPGSSYRLEVESAADAARAVRLLRARAGELGLAPQRIGLWGWSAGAEVAQLVAFRQTKGAPEAVDPIERQSARPDFLIGVYPGARGVPAQLPPESPPAFLVAAFDDAEARQTVLGLATRYETIGVPAEVHLFASGGHGFNLGRRAGQPGVRHWPDRLVEWLDERGLLRR